MNLHSLDLDAQVCEPALLDLEAQSRSDVAPALLQVLVEGIELWDPIYWNLHIFQSVQVGPRAQALGWCQVQQ